MPDVVIVGGGITGVATAYELARRGVAVSLFESRRLAAMASGWTLGGVRQSGRDPAELPLARAAVERWASLSHELGADVGYRRGGNLRLARSDAEVGVIRDLVARQRALGLDLDFLDGNAAVRDVAPAIGPSVLAASFCPTDGHAEPVAAVRAYAASAARAGAVVEEGVGVTRIVRDGRRVVGVETDKGFVAAGTVVVAAGLHTPALLAPLGLDLPIAPHVVTVLQTAPLSPLFAQVFGVANADCAGRQEISGRLRVTSGIGPWPAPVEGWSEDGLAPPAREVRRLVGLIGEVLPALLDAPVARLWGGLIDLTPDALPVIDVPARLDGLVVAAGFSGHGFGIGPATGVLVADLATGSAPALDVTAFRLDRFGDAEGASSRAALTLHG